MEWTHDACAFPRILMPEIAHKRTNRFQILALLRTHEYGEDAAVQVKQKKKKRLSRQSMVVPLPLGRWMDGCM